MTLRPIVIDINHADGSRTIERDGKEVIEDLVDFERARRAGVLAIIHKATEGHDYVDPLYKSRRPKAQAAGLMWGAYHFMRPGDVGNQVSFFLGVVGTVGRENVRLALDYEDDRLGLWQAERWLELVHTVTGQRPWLYGGGLIKEQVERRHSPALAQYPLWLAEYGPVANVPRPWKNYILWQRSGDGVGPGIHDIPGIGRKQDVNYFSGTDEELATAWLDKAPSPTTGVA